MASVEEEKEKKGPAEWRGLVFAASKLFLNLKRGWGQNTGYCPPTPHPRITCPYSQTGPYGSSGSSRESTAGAPAENYSILSCKSCSNKSFKTAAASLLMSGPVGLEGKRVKTHTRRRPLPPLGNKPSRHSRHTVRH